MTLSPAIVRLVIVAAAALLAALPAARAGAAPAAAPVTGGAPRPNILLVLSDDHSAAHVGCYGNQDVRTPNLDAFAASGMRLDRAYVGSPQCVPSRAVYMTGRSAIAVQNTRFSAPLAREYVTFPELLRSEAAYRTGICGRNHHLDGSRVPDELGRTFDDHRLRTMAERVDYLRASNQGKALAEMREFLDGRPAGKPFFLQVGFNDPHRPWKPDPAGTPHDPAALTLPAHYPDTPAVRADLAKYYDAVARMDRLFGEVLAELDRRDLARDTLVVFMADNGASQFRGKGTLYEFGVRVPLIVRWPGVVRPGGTSDALVSGEDLAPTLLGAAGVAAPKEMTGRSFLPLLRGDRFEARDAVFAERGAHGSALPTGSSAFDLGRCVITPRHKLIYTATWQTPYEPVDFSGMPFWKELAAVRSAGGLSPAHERMYFAPTRPMIELYDLTADPGEADNLAGRPEHAALERQLRVRLAEWMLLERDYVPLPVAPAPRATAGGRSRPRVP